MIQEIGRNGHLKNLVFTLCDVTYIHSREEFIFVRYRPYERFRFDDIDLVAIEVFNCLYDLENTF